MRIECSADGNVWEDATYTPDKKLGANRGESTLVYLPQAKQCRYIRVTVKDGMLYNSYNARLADISVF